VRDYEAFMSFIVEQASDGMPDRYDAETSIGTVPRRLLCEGPLCM
jgi:hypothetical protein